MSDLYARVSELDKRVSSLLIELELMRAAVIKLIDNSKGAQNEKV